MSAPWEREPKELERWHTEADLSRLTGNVRSEVLKLRSAIALIDQSFQQSAALSAELQKDWINSPASLRRNEAITRDWARFGAHSAINILYQFQDSLNAIVGWVADHPYEVRNFTDATTAKQGLDLFNRYFPKWEQTRHATAHSSEINRKPKVNAHMGKLSRVVKKPKGVGLMFSDTFVNRIFMATRRGEILEFDTSWTSYIQLLECYDLAISGFALWIGPRPSSQTDN